MRLRSRPVTENTRSWRLAGLASDTRGRKAGVGWRRVQSPATDWGTVAGGQNGADRSTPAPADQPESKKQDCDVGTRQATLFQGGAQWGQPLVLCTGSPEAGGGALAPSSCATLHEQVVVRSSPQSQPRGAARIADLFSTSRPEVDMRSRPLRGTAKAVPSSRRQVTNGQLGSPTPLAIDEAPWVDSRASGLSFRC